MKNFKTAGFPATVILAGVLFLAGGCGKDEESSTGPDNTPPVEKPELLPLPELGFPEVDLPAFKTVEAEPGPRTFRWTLIPGVRIRYEIDTTSWTIDRSSPRPDGSFATTRIGNRGSIDIVGEGDERAKVRITVVPEGVEEFDRENVQRLDFRLEATGGIAPVTREAAMQSGLQLDQLIRLPEVPLRDGESWEDEVVFHGRGDTPSQFGTLKFTRMGRVGVSGEACDRLRLDLACDVRPSSPAMEGSGVLRARAWICYSPRLGRIVRVDGRCRLALRMFYVRKAEGKTVYYRMQPDLDTEVHVLPK